MSRITLAAEKHLSDFGYFIIVSFPVFFIINKFLIGIKGYESFFLRISIGILGLLIVLRKYYPSPVKKIMPLIFVGTLFYAFPFFFFYMLFQNPESSIWMVNVLSGLFFMSFFINWKEYIVFSILGFILAWLVCKINNPHYVFPSNITGLLIIYINPIIYLGLFTRKKDNLQEEKLNSMKVLAGSIAHELRTPLSAIIMDVKYLGKYLPFYQQAYIQAEKAGLPLPEINSVEQQNLSEIPENLQTVSQNANTMITMLLTNLSEGTSNLKVESCFIGACINEALKTYPFSVQEQGLVHWKPDTDFVFKGQKEMMVHVLYNLLKNALYAIAADGKGEIYISLECNKEIKSKIYNRLIFKDTGAGISADIIKHIFDRFYTKTRHGTGIGLAFCQSAIKGFEGEITCTSQIHEYTTFIITLPTESIMKQNNKIK